MFLLLLLLATVQTKDEWLKVTNLTAKIYQDSSNRNIYKVNFTWLPPAFVKPVQYYMIEYFISGYLDNELQCPLRNSSKRACQASNTVSLHHLYGIANRGVKVNVNVNVNVIESECKYIHVSCSLTSIIMNINS